MAVQTHEEVQDLLGFTEDGFLITSFYLNVDATEYPSDELLRTSFDSLMHTAEEQRKDTEAALSHDATESLRGDLARIREWFDEGIDRTDTKSVAIFSCSARGYWELIQMPTATASRVSFAPRAHVGPVATFLSHTKPTAILVTNKERARIFTMKGGEVREWSDFTDFVPQRSAQGGWHQMIYQRKSDNWRKHHVDHAAELVLKLLQHYPFDWLILGNEVQTQADLDSTLHPYLKDRVIGRINVRIDAEAAEIIEKAQEVREQAESQHIDSLIGQVQEFAGAGGRGSIGIRPTLDALNQQRIHILLVQEGYTHPGAECANCGMLTADAVDTCPACNEPARAVENVIESAIEKALELGSTVEVATEIDKLAPIESMGAVLYY
jgi:peptide subunit release factor 1 (eRF1)